jgi:hypothetical protein
MWAHAYPLGATSLSEVEVAALAAWAVKTAWVRERVAERANTADDATRELFARTQAVPPYTSVWASRHEGQSNFRALTARIEVSHQDQHWEQSETRHVHLCALRFQGLAMLIRTDSGSGVPPMSLPADAWQPLAPHSGPLAWPPARAVGDDEVEGLVVNAGSWLRMPPTTNFIRSGKWKHVHHN